MGLFLEGIAAGALLSLLVGPLWIQITYASMKSGKLAGFMTAFGIWISDILYILGVTLFVHSLQPFIKSQFFESKGYWVGGLIFIGFGVFSFIRRKKYPEVDYQKPIRKGSDLITGFLINTINPFTLVFWVGVISTYIISRKIPVESMIWFYLGILGMIVLSDSVKVLLADWVSKKLANHVRERIMAIASLGLVGFGIYMILLGLNIL